MAAIFVSKEQSSENIPHKNIIFSFPGYELSFGTILAKIGRLWVENNSIRLTQILHLSIYRCGVKTS